jgi:hypothetical protein
VDKGCKHHFTNFGNIFFKKQMPGMNAGHSIIKFLGGYPRNVHCVLCQRKGYLTPLNTFSIDIPCIVSGPGKLGNKIMNICILPENLSMICGNCNSIGMCTLHGKPAKANRIFFYNSTFLRKGKNLRNMIPK